MVDFAKLLNSPRKASPKVPALSIGVTGHRPDKLYSTKNSADGYEFGNPLRRRLRMELIRATADLVANAERDRYDAEYRDMFLRRVVWQNGWEVDEKWRTIEVLCLQGGAQGADQDAATAWFQMQLPYVVVMPFPGQEAPWPEPAQKRFARMCEFAAGIYLVSDKKPSDHSEAASMLKARSVRLCEMSDELIGVWDESRGGTSYCVNWWQKVHLGAHFTHLDPREWRLG